MEVWKDVNGYEGYYQVSNFGRVKSLARVIKATNRFLPIKERILVQSIDTVGYRSVGLIKDYKKNTVRIHQLVAITFLGHKPCGHKLVINHKDFNRLNNNVNNLEIITARENCNQKHLKSTSIYTGVSWCKKVNKWVAGIQINGKTKYLGSYNSELKASESYEYELLKLKIL
jgi:hypothetical protein